MRRRAFPRDGREAHAAAFQYVLWRTEGGQLPFLKHGQFVEVL